MIAKKTKALFDFKILDMTRCSVHGEKQWNAIRYQPKPRKKASCSFRKSTRVDFSVAFFFMPFSLMPFSLKNAHTQKKFAFIIIFLAPFLHADLSISSTSFMDHHCSSVFFYRASKQISCIQLEKRKLLVENSKTFLLRVLSSSLKASSCFKWHKKANISIAYQNHYKRKIFSDTKKIQLLLYYLFLILINIWIES